MDRILYIDDSAHDRALVRDALEVEHGSFRVTETASRAEFEAQLAHGEFDLVLSDFNILGYDGLQVLDAVKAKKPGLPVLIVTGTGSEEIAVEAMKRGAVDYVIKTPQHIQRLPLTIQSVLRDITERKRAEQELHQFRLAMNVSADSIYLTDMATMRFVYVNDAACRRLGFNRDQLLRMGPQDVLKADREQLRREYDDVIATGDRGVRSESRFLRRDGSEGWTEIHRRALQADGEWLLVTIGRDITARKHDERAVRDSEVRFRQTFELAASGMAHVGLDGRYLRVNRKLCEMLGYPEEEIIGRSVKDISHPEDRDVTDAQRARVRAREADSASFEKRYLRKDGSVLWVSLTVALARDAAGEPEYEISVLEDITERRRMEQALRESEVKFRGFIEQASDGIFVTDEKANFLLVNSRYCEMLGYSEHELLQLNVADTYPEQEREHLAQRIAQLSEVKNRLFERMMQRKDGTRLPIEVSVRFLANGMHQGIVRDISERRRAEQLMKLEHAVASRLADAGNATEGLKAVIRAVCETEAWECGRYFRVDDAAGVLRLAGSWGVQIEAIERFIAASREITYAPGVGLAGRVWQSGQPLWVSDIGKDARVAQVSLARATDMHGAFVFPVISEGKTIGVLAFNSRQVREPEERLLQAISVIGSQIGQFMVRKAQQERIARLNRIYSVLSGINSAIVRIRDRDELFREACRIAVEAGRFRMAWIGVVNREAARIDPVAWLGVDEGYIRLMPLELNEAASGPPSLSGRAVNERKPMVADDMATDPRVLLKKEAGERGFHSLAILPLLVAEEAVGVLALYAAEVGFFDAEEMRLLLELAGDISFALDHIEKEKKLDYLAFYDQFTGLANRTLFLERLSQSTHTAARSQGKFALVVADLERFRTINESLGRQAGDALLKLVAERLANAAGETKVGRIGVDHFAVVLAAVKGRSQAGRNVQNMTRRSFGEPFSVDGMELRVSARTGIALFPSDGADAETLLKHAEAALRKGKESGERNTFYTPDLAGRSSATLTLENKLRQALEKEEFVLHYQPKLELEIRRIVGVEALMRWQSPELGLVPPLKFISLMEETGMILEAGAWALQRAALDHRRWLELGLRAPRVAVNVSPLQLRQRDFVRSVERAIMEGIAPTGIDLEITESLIMEDIEGNIQKLKEVRGLGLSIAIDDFGTGYSSLAYLAKLPVQSLKIDRAFIITMLNEPDTMTLVQTIISLAHSLRLKVVAEGVDAEDQAKFLRLLRCDEMQGYLFSKPLPFEQMTALLRQGQPG